ncbi:MAG: DegT/DnrJ/EryC1/StrS family aminotransferase [Acidobacteria bacterium]|nr:DegT/DnrJ/EryC1/StrS family aminotransferase [Acidobacteriota bacterium]
MLDRIIQQRRQDAESRILRNYRERFQSFAMLVPSARYGIYGAAKALLRAGDRVIISPITCRSVIRALLAAGVHPVFADIELDTGNIDPARLPNALSASTTAIVTTNLYGNPDSIVELRSVARSRGLLLIEDCAHAMHTTVDGKPVGCFGDIALFSFKKYFNQSGGVVTVRDPSAAAAVARLARTEIVSPPEHEERARYLQYVVEKEASHAVAAALSAVYRLLRDAGSRVPRAGEPLPAPQNHEEQAPFSRILPTTAVLLRVGEMLARIGEIVAERKAAAQALIAECPLPLKRSRLSRDVCYLAVPFGTTRRDKIVATMQARGIPTYFLYSPPMNELFGVPHDDYKPDEGLVREWCRTILPINPRFGPQYLECIGASAA